MSEPGEQDEGATKRKDAHGDRVKDSQRRSQKHAEDAARLRDRLLDTAESVRRSHEQIAKTMTDLAETGSAEYATRRRRSAERSRQFADEEARQIAELTAENSRDQDRGGRAEDRSDTNPA